MPPVVLPENSPCRCVYRIAMLYGWLRAHPLMLTILPTRSGNMTPAARLCMPPMLAPTLANSRSMPRPSSSRNCARTISSIVTIGNRVAYASPSAGSMLAGPVEP